MDNAILFFKAALREGWGKYVRLFRWLIPYAICVGLVWLTAFASYIVGGYISNL